MKTLIQILLLVCLVGCASPYYPVYVNSEGDHYIAEKTTSGGYYGSGYMMFTDIGLYPWWIRGYPPPVFAYYSPYFYPYYFSVWYPPGYHPWYAYYREYYAYRHPAYHYHRHYGRRPGRTVVASPAPSPSAPSYTRSPARPYDSRPRMRSARPDGFSRSSSGSMSNSRGMKVSRVSPALNKQ